MSTAIELRTQRFKRKRGDQRRQQGITGRVPGQPVARHVRQLIDSGWTRLQLAAEASLSDRAVRYILSGQPTVQRANAARLLNIKPLTGTHQPAIGAVRRIKALSRAGYPIAWTAAEAGCCNRHIYEILNGSISEIRNDLAHRLADVYRRHEATPGPSGPARIAATTKGWDGPWAWDVDSIDDPATQPATEGEDKQVTRDQLAAFRREEVAHLASFGLSEHEIAGRLGMAYTTVRNIVLELRTGQRRVRAPEGANAPGTGLGRAA